jgi:hypothetical protein
VNAARPSVLATTLAADRERAFLFRELARLRTDLPLFGSVDELRWIGPTPAFADLGQRLDRAAAKKL